MHVGLNLVFLVPGETGGMEVYARELIPALLAAAPEGTRFTAFINREAARAAHGPWSDLVAHRTVPVNARSRVQWVLGEQVLLPSLAARAGIDLLHSLGSTAPLRGRFCSVVTVHDLIYARFPETHAGLRGHGMRVLVPQAARRADRVVTDSQSTREDLNSLLAIDADRVDVIPLGIGTLRREEPLAEAEVRVRFRLGERRLLLSLSAKRPHKNLTALIDALALMPDERRPLVVVPGYRTWHERELREHASLRHVDGDIRFLDWLFGAELEGLWATCEGFVFPSLYEGFGLPVLEAMARGVPVACADSSSLPEVAGDAALLFDPHDPRAIAAAIEELLRPERAARLRASGLRRAREFTWERTARATLDSYGRALASA